MCEGPAGGAVAFTALGKSACSSFNVPTHSALFNPSMK